MSKAQELREAQTEFQEVQTWKCLTCESMLAPHEPLYCIHCKLYWDDVNNGLYE